MELKDFQNRERLTFGDFEGPSTRSKLGLSTSSAAMLSSFDVLTGGDEVSVDSFRKVKNDLLDPQGRENFILRQEQKRNNIINSFEDEVPEVLLDQNLEDEEKKTFLESVKNAPDFFKLKNLNILAENSAMTVTDPEETEEASESRLEYADVIDEVHQQKALAANALQAWQAAKDEGTLKKVGEIAELMTPFAEWLNFKQFNEFALGEEGEAILPGSMREEFTNALRSMPYNKRAELTEKLIEFTEEHGGLILTDNNDLSSVQILEDILVNNDYSDVDKWVDNIFSVLDVAGIASLIGAPFARTAASVNRARKASTYNLTHPTSPSQIVKDANPDVARGMKDMASESDEAAEALYGTNKTDAVAKDDLPEPELDKDSITNKADTRGPQFEEPEEIRNIRDQEGNLGVTDEELARARAKKEASLLEVEGMEPRREMMSVVENDDGSTTFKMIYTPKDAGFKTADRALENAKYAFRNFQLEDTDFVLYRRSGDKWIETTSKLLKARKKLRDEYTRQKKKIPADLKDIDYAVGIHYNYKFDPTDLEADTLLSKAGRLLGIPLNLLDRLPAGLARIGQGSIIQHVLPANFMLDPRIVGAAAVKQDKSMALRKLLVKNFEGFTKGYSKLKKPRREKMAEYIHEANFYGVPFDSTDLLARGFSTEEVNILREWRKANDTLWYVTNQDLSKTMRSRGYKIYTDENDSRFVVKPAKRGSVSTNTKFYDPIEDRIRSFDSAEEIDEFYEAGGVLAKSDDPMKIGDDYVDTIISRETAEGGYMREIADSDILLNYRDGYYPVMYDANFFIEKTITMADGSKTTKVIATSRNKEDAAEMTKKLQETYPDDEFDFRVDRRSQELKDRGVDEPNFAIGVSSGLSNQKVRGQRLKDADVDLHKAGNTNLHDPLEAISHQIVSLSEKVMMRQYMETTKQRWIQNFADKLKLEKNKYGEYEFPSKVSQIVGKGTTDSQTVADARSLFNYIYHLENGYINLVDEGTKATLSFGADLLAEMGAKALERGMRGAATKSPTSTAKGTAFKLFLAANPARQLIIQAHQNVQLAAVNPTYMAGGLQWDLHRINLARRGLSKDEEAIKMWEELKYSGMMEAVDANNLIRNDMLHLADLTASQKLRTAAGAPINMAQKVGFDTAEQSVLVMSWLTHRNMAIREGRKLTRREYGNIAAQARAFTYNMNRAGDMPYNQNSLNIIAQFLQVPHKAALQPFLDRNLTKTQRARLLAFNTVMYGVPTGLMTSIYQNMDEGPQRDVLEKGLEHLVLNHALSQATGKRQALDWSDLAPNELHGFGDTITGIWTSGLAETVANTPSASLLFGHNPRIRNVFSTAAKYVVPGTNYEDPELKVKYSDVVQEAASLFSGMNNAFKAMYALETGKKMNSLGNISDRDVTKTEATLQFFGFRTETESGRFNAQEMLHEGADYASDDNISLWYKELKRVLALKETSVAEDDMARRVISEAYRVFQHDKVKFHRKLRSMINNDLKHEDYSLFKNIQSKMGFMDDAQMRTIINQLGDSEMKDSLLKQLDALEEATSEARK